MSQPVVIVRITSLLQNVTAGYSKNIEMQRLLSWVFLVVACVWSAILIQLG